MFHAPTKRVGQCELRLLVSRLSFRCPLRIFRLSEDVYIPITYRRSCERLLRHKPQFTFILRRTRNVQQADTNSISKQSTCTKVQQDTMFWCYSTIVYSFLYYKASEHSVVSLLPDRTHVAGQIFACASTYIYRDASWRPNGHIFHRDQHTHSLHWR